MRPRKQAYQLKLWRVAFAVCDRVWPARHLPTATAVGPRRVLQPWRKKTKTWPGWHSWQWNKVEADSWVEGGQGGSARHMGGGVGSRARGVEWPRLGIVGGARTRTAIVAIAAVVAVARARGRQAAPSKVPHRTGHHWQKHKSAHVQETCQ